MSALQEFRDLLLGAMVIAGCSEQNDPTAPRALPPASFAAVVSPLTSVDTDPTASPAGYPFTKNTAFPSEFMIQYRVYRSGFTDPLDPTSSPGVLVDRRPLLTGGQAILTPIKVSIDGTQISFVASAGLLG